MTNHKTIGKRGEAIARDFLIANDCQIHTMNFYSRFGEIDIVAQERDTLIFVEVKYRKNEHFATAAESITLAKQDRIRKTIATYLQQFPTDQPLRIDLITIIGQYPYKIDWLKNIF